MTALEAMTREQNLLDTRSATRCRGTFQGCSISTGAYLCSGGVAAVESPTCQSPEGEGDCAGGHDSVAELASHQVCHPL